MEFNTDSVWSLISLLILIIIGIVVWYFYNEVEFLNAKVIWLEGKFEETISQVYKQIYELQSSSSDLEVEYDEEEDDFEHPVEEIEEDEELKENDDVDEPEFEQEHPQIYEVDQSQDQGCEHVMITGKRKGQSCGKPVKEDGKCSTHCE